MLGKFKGLIQDRLYKKCIDEYQKELKSQTDPYLMWIKEKEIDAPMEDFSGVSMDDIVIVFMESCGKDFMLSDCVGKYIVFTSQAGELSDKALFIIKKYFDQNNDVDIVYADEDAIMSNHRFFPWTKPVWSPDTLLSFLYFGNIFAIRGEVLEGISWLGSEDYRKNIYDMVLKATERTVKIEHMDNILFHLRLDENDKDKLMNKEDFIGAGSAYDDVRKSAFSRRGINARVENGYPVYEVKDKPLVSIIIPSKDNPKVLKQCIESVYNNTSYKNFEIIVVDNGSDDNARKEIENFRADYNFDYIYKPMDFNFSKMCNLGADAAKGEYILLLNDDMEAIEASWLERMLGQATLPYVGAVGAKLLYPNSSKIQHVGITNTIWGPGHKLKLFDDNLSYYYGRNKFIYDLVGVTAACLLMRKALFEEIGGMYEGLAVAYNDVDLCFRLHEKGLYNVQRNDVVLYHHESLSRGDDMQDENKLNRLKAEQKVLYGRHIQLFKVDPFIGTLLNDGEPAYSPRWLEGYELVNTFEANNLKEASKLPPIDKMNQAIMIVVEDCGREKNYYLIKGWAYVPGVDNARYTFKLLFVNPQGKVWELPLKKRYRKDVASILPDEKNVELTGFCNWIYEGTLPADTYEIWMTAKDGCSRQKLYRNTKKTLVIND
jgi:GT2 family glycosyltransferase